VVETVGAYDAKTHLPRLLDEVATSGKSFVITKHGVPVARLVPARFDASAPEEVIAALRAARRGVRLGGLTVREMIEEGRR
jgi:prevent-host-death family protein